MKEYENAISSLKAEPKNPSTQDILALLDADAAYFKQSALLCDKLRGYCRTYWWTAKSGDVIEAQQEYVVKSLDDLAQIGEAHIERRRNLLTAIHKRICSIGCTTHGFVPAQGQGAPVLIEYRDENEMVRIEMPGIVPFKLKKGTSYLYGKIAYHMSEFMLKMQRERNLRITIPYAVVAFIHHYIDGEKSLLLRDYDNLEKSCVLNALQTSGLFADNSGHMALFEMTAKADRNFTEVLIAPFSKLHGIIAELDTSMYGMEGIKKSQNKGEAHL